MNSSVNKTVILPPVNLAVIFDQISSTGGGYQQALNVVISINSAKKINTIDQYFLLFMPKMLQY